jgi:prepilin-type N-terminal cleavage/methylation domain-containing protein
VRVDVLSRRGDAGYTLVELLVVVSLVGVVVASVAGMSLVAVRTAASADTRLDDSNDLLRAATYFGDDVQGAQSVSVGTTPRCGTDPSVLVEFVGQDFTDDSTFTTVTTVVSYVRRTVGLPTGVRRELHRLSCSSPVGSPAYPLAATSDVPVVLGLSPAVPVVGCGTAGCAAFTEVNLTIQQSSGLRYVLTGRRRTTP